ncbi:hypothetical protein L345_04740, partial [Ophiophagus hannah]
VEILLFNIYIPPLNKNDLINKIWDGIEDFILGCSDKYPTAAIIIGGDLNARMGPNDQALFNQFKTLYDENVPEEPLHSRQFKDPKANRAEISKDWFNLLSRLESQNTQVKIKWTEKNAKEVTKWMLVPGTIELRTSLVRNEFEGSYLRGKKTHSKKPILKNKKWFDRDCVQLKRIYNKEYRNSKNAPSEDHTHYLKQVKAQYKIFLKEKKSAALKESWHRLIAPVKTKNASLFWYITRGLGKSPLFPTNQVPIHAWEEYFRELYTDPDYVTAKLIWPKLLTGPRLHQERYPS